MFHGISFICHHFQFEATYILEHNYVLWQIRIYFTFYNQLSQKVVHPKQD
jgi:hypothetical protein